MLQLDPCLEIAKSAALLAGAYIKDQQNKDLEILLNEGRDIKLQIDVDAEKIIKDHLIAESSFPILAEESGASNELNDFYWVVDPLDGTSNFLRNIPISCVSIALMQDIDPILGVIFDFNNDDLYFAHHESKAYMNDSELSVSSIKLKSDATLVTGIPAKKNYSDKEFKNMISDFQSWKKIRMIGSAAMASVYVASGRADAYSENGIFLWDIAAGAAIVKGLLVVKSFYRILLLTIGLMRHLLTKIFKVISIINNMKGIVWFRSDLRIDDNPALNAALSNCDEVLAIYIFSQSQWEIHNESNIKQEFLFNNLTELKEALANLNIPLVAINTDSYKTLPQDLSSFAVEQKINHVFC
jgi:myo-inositol-1(or 4)-monophosphatase